MTKDIRYSEEIKGDHIIALLHKLQRELNKCGQQLKEYIDILYSTKENK